MQPVPRLSELITSHGAMEADKDSVRQEPCLTWDPLDRGDTNVLKELSTLLRGTHLEDEDSAFRSQYSPEFLLRALRPPPAGSPRGAVGSASSNKLVGFISAIPAEMRVGDRKDLMCSVRWT